MALPHPFIFARKPLVLMLTAFAATSALAQSQQAEDRLDQSLWLQFGAFRPSIDSRIQANNTVSGALGTEIGGEHDLGLADRKTVGTLLLGARIDERWRAEFEYFELNRSASQNLFSGNINFGQTTYPVSAALMSEFDSKVYRLSLGYSFIKTPQAEFGGVFGLHVTDFRFVLQGLGSVGGAAASTRREETSRHLPLPTVGLYATYAFAPRWMLAGRGDVFSLNSGGDSGSLVNLQANLLYRFNRHVALGVGYRLNDYVIKSQRDSWQGEVRYKFRGPQVLLDVGF